ncbi:MAG: hypothetical protein FJ109_17460 [Deltaproteobacteria bacterium]|nr:hypothetical protein [Deltaproteobacteria bacterium]
MSRQVQWVGGLGVWGSGCGLWVVGCGLWVANRLRCVGRMGLGVVNCWGRGHVGGCCAPDPRR